VLIFLLKKPSDLFALTNMLLMCVSHLNVLVNLTHTYNDIGDDIKSKLRLFADDSLLYLVIDCTDDCSQTQKNLDKLVNWASEWQMEFNASKCYVHCIKNYQQEKACPT
jgi:hypothetical protein